MADEYCGNCLMYEHVPEEERIGKQWKHGTGYCGRKPPSSHRSTKQRVALENWCSDWRRNMDVSKKIIEEGNRRFEAQQSRHAEAAEKFVTEMATIDAKAVEGNEKEDNQVPYEGEVNFFLTYRKEANNDVVVLARHRQTKELMTTLTIPSDDREPSFAASYEFLHRVMEEDEFDTTTFTMHLRNLLRFYEQEPH